MSRAVERRYRVRFAQRGAPEVEGYVEFTLDLGILAVVPVVAGSFVHPLDGATELRPLHVEGADVNGTLIQAFTDTGRWVALGRLVDIQWQNTADDETSDPWTTYGTGRCSGLDEADGPGKFRIEISDESWVARRGKVFTVADTTQLWPAGIRYIWRGFAAGLQGAGTRISSSGNLYRIDVSASGRGSVVTSDLLNFVKNDAKPPSAIDNLAGNFKHLRATYDGIDYEVNGFGTSSGYTLLTLETAESTSDDSFTVWIVWPGIPFVVPPASGDFTLYAPTASPSNSLPLHVGVEDADHQWGYPNPGTPLLATGGFLHPADITKRVYEALGVRYNASNLDAIEADISYPLLAPYILSTPDNPQRWLQDEVFGSNMLLALRDRDGRMKLVDLRPPPDSVIAAAPILDATNSKLHRWRLVGRECMNSIRWEFATYGQMAGIDVSPAPEITTASGTILAANGESVEAARLDDLVRRLDTVGPFQSDNVDYVGLRERTFSAHAPLEPLEPLWPGNIARQLSLLNTGRGSLLDYTFQPLAAYMLEVYQDGPLHGTCEIAGSLAETLEEGDYALVHAGSVKIVNASTAARSHHVLVLLLPLTRYPAHVEAEYLVIRPVYLWICPAPFYSPYNAHGTIRIALGPLSEPPTGTLTLQLGAKKDAQGGHSIDMRVVLYDGSTVIAIWDFYDVSEVLYVFDLMLTSGEQASITDWNNLALEITRLGDLGGPDTTHRRLEIHSLAVAA